MFRYLLFIIQVPLILLSFNSYAADKLSCVELATVADNLNDLAAIFQSSKVIQEGGPVDLMLRDMIDDLHIIAISEGERDLYIYVSGLENAWHDMDIDYMAEALDGVIDSFDRLLRRDCY